jgi:hypothetical protein
VIWAGTDDGNVQTTSDGGATWTNVTPTSIKPWTRFFNIDAGHFDDRTAYAAANTMRVDDMNPHFFRTHDGGKTWTEITNGIAPGNVSNAIREDPRVRGLLYASTDAQVWVSTDDGDHWQSLRLNMPAISVRDLLVKDDSTCLCSDLIAATHGRGFWILDNLTPLRQAAAIQAAERAHTAYLVRPATAVRVRFAANDPTPWPPELPAGENPPLGGVIDYYLSADAGAPVKLEIVDGQGLGTAIRSYSSADPVRSPHPALDPEAYNRLCQQNPTAQDCNLPLYWPGPPITLSAKRGMHRFSWDLRYAAIRAGEPDAPDDEDATGAVPHRMYAQANAPWAPPGSYTVRLTVDGKTYTQPLTLRLDPRVSTPAAGLTQLATLSRQLYDEAVSTHRAYLQARALATRLDSTQTATAALRARIDSIAPPQRGRGGRGGRGGGAGGPGGRFGGPGAAAPPTLESASNALLAAAMSMQAADVTPTARQVAAASRARADASAVMAKWNAIRTNGLTSQNR